jgi:hypothetical protein
MVILPDNDGIHRVAAGELQLFKNRDPQLRWNALLFGLLVLIELLQFFADIQHSVCEVPVFLWPYRHKYSRRVAPLEICRRFPVGFT